MNDSQTEYIFFGTEYAYEINKKAYYAYLRSKGVPRDDGV